MRTQSFSLQMKPARLKMEILKKVVKKIQKDFDAIGANVQLNSIPYHVATLEPGLAGICVYRDDKTPVGVAVNHTTIKDWLIENDTHYGLIYKTLLHEIGHCFFQRTHDYELLMIPDHIMYINGFPMEAVEVSVMIDSGKGEILKALWPYYVKEIAGYDRLHTIDDLRKYVTVNLN